MIAQNDEMALGAIEAIRSAGLKANSFAIAGIDGVTDAIQAVKRGEMASILQDAKAQIQASIDVAMRAVLGPGYRPLSPIWKQYAGSLEWNDGQSRRYAIPWTVVTPANADNLLQSRR